MRILVTGGAGFIGSHVIEAYLNAGHEVCAVDNLSQGRRENLPPQVPLYEVDIRSPALATVFDEVQPEIVSHHAAQVSVATSVAHPTEDVAVNVLGMVNVLEQAARHGARQVIFSSSVAVYGNPQYQPCDEAHPTQPLSPYGLSKLTGEAYLRLLAELFGLRCTIFRYGNVYGPRQSAEGEAGVVAIFADQMLAREPVIINGDGLQTRDFVYVGDIARANLLAVERGAVGPYNLGTGQATTIHDLWLTLRSLTGYAGAEVYGPPRQGDIRQMVLEAGLAARELGWRPQVSLEEGLQQTVTAFSGHIGV